MQAPSAAGGEDMELEEGEMGAPPPSPPPQQGMDTASAMAAAAYGYTDPYGQAQWGAYDAQVRVCMCLQVCALMLACACALVHVCLCIGVCVCVQVLVCACVCTLSVLWHVYVEMSVHL